MQAGGPRPRPGWQVVACSAHALPCRRPLFHEDTSHTGLGLDSKGLIFTHHLSKGLASKFTLRGNWGLRFHNINFGRTQSDLLPPPLPPQALLGLRSPLSSESYILKPFSCPIPNKLPQPTASPVPSGCFPSPPRCENAPNLESPTQIGGADRHGQVETGGHQSPRTVTPSAQGRLTSVRCDNCPAFPEHTNGKCPTFYMTVTKTKHSRWAK